MNIVLFGSSDLTLAVANQLEKMGYCPNAIVTSNEIFKISYNPNGVKNVRYVDLKKWAEPRKIPCYLYQNNEGLTNFLTKINAEFALVVGWYHMIPKNIRVLFSKGCAGIHASLLPKFRGGAPLNWALLAGESKTGVSLFELGDGIDDGLLYGQSSFCIEKRSNISDLVQFAEESTLKLLSDQVPKISDGKHKLYPQEGIPSYGLQRVYEDGKINWSCTKNEIDLLIRAVSHPYSGAFTFLGQDKIFIWEAEPTEETIYGKPGQLIKISEDKFPYVVTGIGALRIINATGENNNSLLDILLRSSHKCFN